VADERLTLEVGRIVKSHGLRGLVIVDLWTDRDERVVPGAVLESPKGSLTVVSAHRHQERWLVQFAEISGKDAADTWRGTVLSAEPLEDDDAIWIHELYSCVVYDQHGTALGTVVEVEANPASDLLVLDNGHLIPLTFVTEIEPNVRLDVDVPEGLFE